MAIPRWFVNGDRINNPPGGAELCKLDPPFTRHATLEVLIHTNSDNVELRHYGSDGAIRKILLCANQDMIYLTVEPGDWLSMIFSGSISTAYVQGSLYVW